MCNISSDYDVQIETELYSTDYDLVDIEQNEINNAESDILFE
jgi:hypothetical protein